MVDNENIKTKEESVELILRLLSEYSDKLNKMYDRYRKEGGNINFMVFLLSVSCVLIMIFGQDFWEWVFDNRVKSPIYFSVFMIFLVFGVAIIFRVILVMVPSKKPLRRNLSVLLAQLKRVIKLASQLEDKSVSNVARRLELGLRVSEAEVVCEMISRELRIQLETPDE